jgi:imidazolonepropionase-like amidohydrolase
MTLLRTSLFLVGALAVAAAPPPQGDGPLVLTHIAVVDISGGPTRPNMTVVIRDDRIVSVEPSARAAPEKNATVVDGRGAYLIPGLWDMHVHISWTGPGSLPVLVANGVMGVRDMGGRLVEIDDWRTRIAAGLVAGPRIYRAGPILNGKKFNPLQMVPGTPAETRGVAKALKEVGVDFLKVHRRLEREPYFALIDEAKKQDLRVVGHIPMTVTPEEASDAGQATIEHTETLFEGTFSAGLKERELPVAIRRFRADAADALFARFVRNGTVVTPTLVAYASVIQAADGSALEDPNLRYVAASLKKQFLENTKPVSPEDLAELKATLAELRAVVAQMHRDGVPLLAGTDLAGSRVPGFTLHDELAFLAEAGLTPVQALQTATRNPAKVLGKSDELGAVEAGKIADLVLLEADPLQDIRNTRRIRAVVANGRLLDRSALDRLLRDGEEQAKKN